jgi:hypothetical protein
MNKTRAILWVLAVGLAVGTRPSSVQGEEEPWLAKTRFGVFTHYLVGANYNQMADSFDVEKFADQIAQTRADYLIFTVGQNSGYFCTPNAAYEKYAGYASGQRCTRRDLPMEIADALRKRKIRLILYSSARAPEGDAQALAGLHDSGGREVPQEFIKRWSEVIREWSLRYGDKVSGWWFDGMHREEFWNDYSKPYNYKTFAAACRAGNPNSVLAFNNGAEFEKAFKIFSDAQDYMAGEQGRFGATPEFYPPYPKKVWHILSYLGYWWGQATGPNYTDAWLIDYVKKVNRQGGVVSIDVNVSTSGVIYPPHLQQLIALGKGLEK